MNRSSKKRGRSRSSQGIDIVSILRDGNQWNDLTMNMPHVRLSYLSAWLVLFVVFCISPAMAQTAASRPWVALTRGDLASIHETILENHPGPVDPLNPGYRRWLEDGYRRALALADSVENLDGLKAVLSFYTSGFEDGHMAWGLGAYQRTAVQSEVALASPRSRRGEFQIVRPDAS